jgi:CelD/BcsL family acetyltransferase involved in cellulose biosynthesis
MYLVDEAVERLSVERVDNAAALAALAEHWNALAGDIPFNRHEWLESWWRHYAGAGDELFVLSLRRPDGELVGIAPWYRATALGRLRVLRQLGSGEVASDYVGILADPRHVESVANELSRWLADEAAAEWELIEIDAVRADDAAIKHTVDGMRAREHLVDERVGYQTWQVPLAKTWEEHVARLSKSRREQLRRLKRRSLDIGRAVPREAKSEEDVELGLRILADLHQRRRESLGDTGCFASPRFAQFHAEVARRFFDLGRLRLRWLEYNGQPGAVEYSLTGGDTVYYYQSGLDPAFFDEQPGWAALVASLGDAIEEGYHVFDFLRGDEPYKASLGGEPVPLAQVRIVGRSLLARTHHQMWLAGNRAKVLAKEGLRFLRRGNRATDTSAGNIASAESSTR